MFETDKILSLALVGAPNCGKTTLYNWLTGSKFKTVNYPGATVEYSLGALASHLNQDGKSKLQIMDTPGTYSLQPKSADEVVTVKSIYENPQFGRVEAIAVVVDGTQLSRHLFLAQQVFETGFPMVLVVTMSDLLKKQNIDLDIDLLKQHFKCPVVTFDGIFGKGLPEILKAVQTLRVSNQVQRPIVWDETTLPSKVKMVHELADKALAKVEASHKKLNNIVEKTASLDRYLLHPVFGIFLFFAIMATLFTSIFWLASPFMDMIDKGFSFVAKTILDRGDGALWAQFLANGVISSFSAVLVFVPQIFILFFGVGILESTGYLARAATLIDRPFSKFGMSGRSFVPVLSGFACAVPAIMATRNISSKRDRLITSFILPLMTCSARLPVYTLLLSFLFKDQAPYKAGIALAGLYLGSLVVGAFAAMILNRILSKHKDFTHFLMELPLYRIPKWKVLFTQSLNRTSAYAKRAGPLIFLFAVILWVGTTFPNYENKDDAIKIETSYMGQLGAKIEPVFQPMGADWRVGIGLMSAFAAREVFASSLAVVFNATNDDADTQNKNLLDSMVKAKDSSGRMIFTGPSVIALILFFMIAMQCISTFGVMAKESGSLKLATVQLISFNVVAYILAVLVFQVGKLIVPGL